VSQKPKLYLVPVSTLRGNVAHEWRAAGPLPSASERSRDWRNAGSFARIGPEGHIAEERRRGQFWTWLARLTGAARERARGSLLLPGGRAGW